MLILENVVRNKGLATVPEEKSDLQDLEYLLFVTGMFLREALLFSQASFPDISALTELIDGLSALDAGNFVVAVFPDELVVAARAPAVFTAHRDDRVDKLTSGVSPD